MENLNIVCYDISSPKTARKLRKALSPYDIGGQKSVRYCVLSDHQIYDILDFSSKIMNKHTDSLFIFSPTKDSIRQINLGTARDISLKTSFYFT